LATCDTQGDFALTLPEGPFHRLTATSGYSHATTTVSRAAAIAGPVRIELQPLLYEKVSFVTRTGEPVAVAGRLECAVFPRQPVYASFYPNGNHDVSWMPPEVDLTLHDNDLVYLTTARAQEPGPRVIDFEGYEPVEIPVQLRPLDEWPQGRRIVLTEDSDEAPAVPHRVVFPDAALPDGWGDDAGAWLDMPTAVVRKGKGGLTHWVCRRHPVFSVPRGTDVFVRVVSERTSRDFSLRDERGEVSVLVEWPRYAFLDLRFPVRHPEVQEATSSASAWTSETVGSSGRLVVPGHARFPYLPEGECHVEISWWRSGEPSPFSSWRLRAPIRLAMGLNEFEVREDDVVAEKSR
jgi:hypothetical protein